jgi:hypothetical protein
VSCCPLPNNSASVISTVLLKASFWAGEEDNYRLVRVTGNLGTGTHFSGFRVNQELTNRSCVCRYATFGLFRRKCFDVGDYGGKFMRRTKA